MRERERDKENKGLAFGIPENSFQNSCGAAVAGQLS